MLASGVAAYIKDNGAFARYGKIFSIEENSPIKRVLRYLLQVTENSIFCGVYRRLDVIECKMPDCLAGDWIWICEILIKGKAKMLSETHIYREYEESTSSSFANIARIIGAPRWHAYFPGMAIGKNVAIIFTSWLLEQKKIHNLSLFILKTVIFAVVASRTQVSTCRLAALRIIRRRQLHRQ
jgi:hypothetical protein